MWEVRIFTTNPKDGWRILVGKYGPVAIEGGFPTREAAEERAEEIARTDAYSYGRVFKEE